MRQYFLLCLLLCTGFLSTAQVNQPCGLHQQEGATELFRERLIARKEMVRNGVVTPRNTIYVPIRFHLTAKNNGDGQISEAKVLDQLCELNEDYLQFDIQFYFKQRDDGFFNYINNTTVYENHPATENTIMSFEKDNRAMDVWIVENADLIPGGAGTTLAYYSPSKDWIVISKPQVTRNKITLTHEIGHFFTLDHPFGPPFGNDPFGDESDEIGVPCPAFISGFPTEKVDGSNCEFAGDMLCDTPADYNNGLGWNNCNFTANVLDPNGTQIDPEEKLYMSYFLDCDDEEYHEVGFSPQQLEIINVDINSNSRNYLFFDGTPNFSEVTEQTTLISPIDNETTPNYNQVVLEWESVPNATAYLLEMSVLPTFNINPIRLVVFGTSKVIEGLSEDQKYHWRIRPFNAYSTCMSFSTSESFTTGEVVNTDNPSFVASWSLHPNPVKAASAIQLELNSEKSFVGQIGLFDLTGKTVQAINNKQFNVGKNTVDIPVQQLANGVYILKIQTEAGFLTEKVVVAN